MNEKHIQNALYHWCDQKNHSIIAPNFNCDFGEVDLLSITRAGFVFDHEIKISRSDFKADFRNKDWKHYRYDQAPKENTRRCPNYFIFVVPAGLLKLEEIPHYAGLMYWRESKFHCFGTFDVIKKPPRLHSEPVRFEILQKLARSLMFRYWNNRLKTK